MQPLPPFRFLLFPSPSLLRSILALLLPPLTLSQPGISPSFCWIFSSSIPHIALEQGSEAFISSNAFLVLNLTWAYSVCATVPVAGELVWWLWLGTEMRLAAGTGLLVTWKDSLDPPSVSPVVAGRSKSHGGCWALHLQGCRTQQQQGEGRTVQIKQLRGAPSPPVPLSFPSTEVAECRAELPWQRKEKEGFSFTFQTQTLHMGRKKGASLCSFPPAGLSGPIVASLGGSPRGTSIVIHGLLSVWNVSSPNNEGEVSFGEAHLFLEIQILWLT